MKQTQPVMNLQYGRTAAYTTLCSTSYCVNFEDLKVHVTGRNRTQPLILATLGLGHYTTVTIAASSHVFLSTGLFLPRSRKNQKSAHIPGRNRPQPTRITTLCLDHYATVTTAENFSFFSTQLFSSALERT